MDKQILDDSLVVFERRFNQRKKILTTGYYKTALDRLEFEFTALRSLEKR